MTSGLIIFAKNQPTAAQFGQLFESHNIEKFYLAISKDKPKKKQGSIKGDMIKSRRSAWKLLRTNNNPANTQFFSYGLGDGSRLFVLRPLTGKTHQLRVALNSIGAPIAGDHIYNVTDTSDRGYLHAYALKFELNGQSYQYLQMPTYGQLFNIESVQEKLVELACPWQLSWPK